MAKQAIEGAGRQDLFLVESERLTLVTQKGHPLYDPRAELPPDSALVASIDQQAHR